MDAPLDPHNANRFAYAAGDPVNLSDPTGQMCFWGVIGGALVAELGGGIVIVGVGISGTIAGLPVGVMVSLVGAGVAYGGALYSIGSVFQDGC